MAPKKALGKGLMALLDEAVKDEVLSAGRSRPSARTSRVEEIPIGLIDPNPGQPRKQFDDLQDLVASIRERGILQPLLLRRVGERYQVIAGERRYRAAKEAGKESVPAVVLDADEQAAFEIALIENIQRRDLTPLEEANAYRTLIERFGLTHEEVAKRVGRDRSTVTNSLRLLELPEETRREIARGNLSAGHAKVLAGLRDQEEILRWTRRTVSEGLSVRSLERLVTGGRRKPAPKHAKPDVFLKDFENRLEEIFSTRVRVRGTNRKGKIVIEYYTLEDLERIRKTCERAARR